MRSVYFMLILLVVLYFEKLESTSFLDPGCQPRHTFRMINGGNAGRAPWMAYLIRDGNYICGGSLVKSQFVVTAAHCARYIENFFVRLGEYNTLSTSDGPTRDIPVMRIFLGPSGQDIAILKLAEEVEEYTDAISPICVILTSNPYEDNFLRSFNKFKVTGWGATNRFTRKKATTLQEITVERKDSPRCQNLNGKFCCESFSSQFVCTGDSGSPLTADIKSESGHVTALFGILADSHQRCFDHSIYVDLVPYTSWINITIYYDQLYY